MIQMFILALIASLALAVYYFYIKPKLAVDRFVEQAKKAGYNVKTLPFNPFNLIVMKFIKQDEESLKVFKE